MSHERMPRAKPTPFPKQRNRWGWLALGSVIVLTFGLVGWLVTRPTLRQKAESAERSGNWAAALQAYRALSQAEQGRARDWVGQARALLGLNRAREAEEALRKANQLDPADADAWHLLLELYRVERRGIEAQELGWSAVGSVGPDARKAILRDLTLALLFVDTPLDARAEERARETLRRWLATDPEDDHARAALALRMAVDPNPDDPDRASRIADLKARLDQKPDHLSLRESLIVSLADAGEVEEGRERLDAWPIDRRDIRYDRLRARWDLDFDRKPAEAVTSLIRVLTAMPHDWKSHYRLSRALKSLGRDADSASEAETVIRLRERLEPGALATRLARDLARPDDPESLRDLSNVCAGVGLTRLAEAWASEAKTSGGR